MIDFIEATKFVGKDTPFFGNIQLDACYKSGIDRYSIDGCRQLQIYFNNVSGILTIRGSIMYFIQGHNFTFDKHKFVEAIDYIGKIIEVPLWDAEVRILEYGTIMEVDMKPKEIITHHRPGKGMIMHEKPEDKGRFRSFDDAFCNRKMYDAGRNIQHKQGMTMKGIITSCGWNPTSNYLKWECHYLKPELLNHGRAIQLSDLVNPYWENILKEDLYYQYTLLEPMKSIDISKCNTKPHTMDIIASVLVESMIINDGATLDEVRKMLYDRINAMPLLSQSDKDARKRQVKATLQKLQTTDVSEWDISNLLSKALSIDTSNDETGNAPPPSLI